MYGPITRTQLRPRTANWTEIESSFYEEVSVRIITDRIGTKTQMHVPSFLLVLAGSLVALPGPGRCNSPSHELTIMFAESERIGAQITTLSFSKIRSDLTN